MKKICVSRLKSENKNILTLAQKLINDEDLKCKTNWLIVNSSSVLIRQFIDLGNLKFKYVIFSDWLIDVKIWNQVHCRPPISTHPQCQA